MNMDVFISYRNSDGAANAQLIGRALREQKYSIFFDKISLRSGKFPDQIRKNVFNCTDFIMIITRDYLGEKIHQKNDWVRTEIRLALQYKKNIIPYFFDDKVIYDDLPKDIKDALCYQGLRHNLTPTYDSITELISNFVSAKPSIFSNEDEMNSIISMYDASYGNEFERLKVQAIRSKKEDDKIINTYTKDKKICWSLMWDVPMDILVKKGFRILDIVKFWELIKTKNVLNMPMSIVQTKSFVMNK